MISVTGSREQAAESASPTIPDYELVRTIGRGAFGEVWLARNVTGSFVAVKVVARGTFDHDRPFEREFEGIKRFEPISRSDPSQLSILHVGRGEGFFYYVMELADDLNVNGRSREARSASPQVSGSKGDGLSIPATDQSADYTPHTLRAELARRRLPSVRVLEIAQPLAEALGHLHRHGLVHRDVKPSNVIFVNGRPKLADIGLVTDASDQCSIVGTEGYLPPEGPGTPQADIFAFGKVLYEAATGLDRRQFPDLPPDLKEWPDAAPVLELNQIVLKACAAHVQERYDSADALHTDLTRLAAGKSLRRAHRLEHRWRLVERGAVWLTAVAAVVSLIALANHVHQSALVQPAEKPSTNQLANHYFELGKANFESFRDTNMPVAADNFTKAIQIDTNFALAYGYLAEAYSWGGFDKWNPNWEFLPQAKANALGALALDKSVAEAHLALAWYHVAREWAWPEAEKETELALTLKPKAPLCHLFYAELFKMEGRMREALIQIKEAKDLDAHSPNINARLLCFLREAHQFTNALDQLQAFQLNVPEIDVYGWRKELLCALGKYTDAIELERAHRLEAGEPREKVEQELSELKDAYDSQGSPGYWQLELGKGEERKNIYEQACFYAQVQNTNRAIECLETACNETNVWLTFMVKTDWRLDPVRTEGRFKEILKKMHLE
jgi:serine/threonine protein kinase